MKQAAHQTWGKQKSRIVKRQTENERSGGLEKLGRKREERNEGRWG